MDNPMRGKGSMQGPPPGTGDGPVGMSSGADRRSGGGLGGLGGLGGSQDVDRTTHGVVKSRYIDLTDQVRRMPVALVVTIDQVNVPDLLVTLENTPRMRFQLTQYHWQRIHGGMTSAAPGGSPSSGMGSGAMSRPSASDSRSDPRMNSPMGAGLGAGGGGAARPGTSPDTSAHAAAFLENEQNTVSLVDLTVYGIVNVYERPKDAKPAETPATPPAPTAPGPPASDTKPAGVRPADAKPATTNAAEPKSATRSGDAQTAPSPPALPPEPKESDKPKEAGPPAGSPTPPKAPGDKDAPKKQ